MKHALGASVLVAISIFATPAAACQLDDAVEISSAAIIARGDVRAVALAKVTTVELIPRTPGWPKDFPPNWRASFEVESLLRGSAHSRHFAREQQGGPGACEFVSAPKVGDLRVLYIYDNEQVYDVDLETARRVDATLREVLPSHR